MRKKIIYIVIAVFIVSMGVAYQYYQRIFGTGVIRDGLIYIRSNDDIKLINNKLTLLLNRPNDFLWLAKKKHFTKLKRGRYVIKKGMSLNELINMLRVGNQTPIKVMFHNQDTLEKLAGKVAEQVQADSTSLLKAMKDSLFLKRHHFTEKSALGMYLPNSYELYWDISPKNFRNRMLVEYRHFWTESRLAKAKKLDLTPQEVLTLASIVQKETIKKREQPMVARLYLNRLKSGWFLQSDPTVIFALKEKKGADYQIKRVWFKDLEIESPYNTYKNKGLPPSLIGMPDVSAIVSVLNPSEHHYFYMCASVDRIGFHEFSNSLKQHQRNARKYSKWLNTLEIRR